MLKKLIDFLNFKKYLDELEAIYKAVIEVNDYEI